MVTEGEHDHLAKKATVLWLRLIPQTIIQGFPKWSLSGLPKFPNFPNYAEQNIYLHQQPEIKEKVANIKFKYFQNKIQNVF